MQAARQVSDRSDGWQLPITEMHTVNAFSIFFIIIWLRVLIEISANESYSAMERNAPEAVHAFGQ